MRPGTFDWPAQYAGDTARPLSFTIIEGGEPVDISNCQIKMQVRSCRAGELPILDLSSQDGVSIAITDGPNGMFRVGNYLNPVVSGAFIYDLQMTFPDGRVHTYFRGSYVIDGDVTQ